MCSFAYRLLGLLLIGIALSGSARAQLAWERIGAELPAQWLQDVELGEHGKVYLRWAGDGGRERLYLSTDDGTTWARVETDSVRGLLRVAPSGALFTIAPRAVQGKTDVLTAIDLLSSTDDGLTWTRILEGPAGMYTSTGISDVVFSRSGSIHVSVPLYGPLWSSGMIYARERNETEWKTTGIDEPTAIAKAPGGPFVVGVVDREDTGILSASLLVGWGTNDSLTRIRDSVLVSAVHVSDDWRIVAALSELVPGVAFGTLRRGWMGIALSTVQSGGRTWRRVASDVDVTQIVTGPDGSFFAAGPSGLLRSSDLGESWDRCDTGLPPVFVPETGDSVRPIARIAISPDGWLFAISNGLLYRTRVLPLDDLAPALTPRVRHPMERVPFRVPAKYAGAVPADRSVWVPKGWSVKLFHAGGLQQPRFLAWGPDSVLHVANLGGGRVLALPDRDRDGVADTVIVAASGVFAHDVKFFRGAMYAAEETRVIRLVDTDGDGVYEDGTVFIDSLPSGGHITRTIVFDTARSLVFVSVGSACNACRDSVQAVVWAFDLDGGNRRIFANGVRNAVGMSLHPVTGQLWATNNGQDWQGDDVPPEWISIVRDGGFYGYPIAYSDQRYFDFDINDQYRRLLPITPADSAKVRSMLPFSAEVTAHSAPMAIEFADASVPEPYRDGAFVALHGSWNRSIPSGHSIVHLELDGPLNTIADAVSFVLSADTLEPGSPIDWLSPCGLESDSRGNLYFTSDRGTTLIGVLSPPGASSGLPIEAASTMALRVVPNPALDRATLVVSIAEPAHCVLELFDALGTRVRIVADRHLSVGSHRIELDLSGLAAGVYQARLSAPGSIVSTGVRVVR